MCKGKQASYSCMLLHAAAAAAQTARKRAASNVQK
jgi:hypothetical protein